jgi:serine phosphatase RsbU (regulator of sigma subunit)
MPFGCIPDEKYENMEFDLANNDRLIFYTDGVIELKNSEGRMFGQQNFHKLIKAIGKFELEVFTDKIIEIIKKWYNTSEEVFADDVTLIVFDIKI